MSGTLPSATFLPSNYTIMSGSAYPLALDADWAVAQRMVGPFAPRPLPTPVMALRIDPGHLFANGSLVEIGAFAPSAGIAAGATNLGLSGTAPYAAFPPANLGIAAGLAVEAYAFQNGALVQLLANECYVTSIAGTTINIGAAAIASAASPVAVKFAQPVGNSGSIGIFASGSNLITSVSNIAGMFVGMALSGSYVASGATIAGISGSTITMSANATGSPPGTPVAFGVTVPPVVTHPRLDRVVLNRLTGAVFWVKGTEAALPSPPAIPVGYAPCCQLFIGANTVLTGNYIIDERDLATLGSQTIQPRPYQYSQPISGGGVTISNGVELLIVDPASGLASLTLTMPASPLDGQRVGLSFSQTVTTLTMNANTGQTLLQPLTSVSSGNYGWWYYRAANATWYRGG